jgi:hypothetical protein
MVSHYGGLYEFTGGKVSWSGQHHFPLRSTIVMIILSTAAARWVDTIACNESFRTEEVAEEVSHNLLDLSSS